MVGGTVAGVLSARNLLIHSLVPAQNREQFTEPSYKRSPDFAPEKTRNTSNQKDGKGCILSLSGNPFPQPTCTPRERHEHCFKTQTSFDAPSGTIISRGNTRWTLKNVFPF
jgi:hypothetical protein